MQTVMAMLTDKEQSVVGPIHGACVPTLGASLTRAIGIHFDSHAACKHSLVGDVAVQLGKGPRGDMPICLALLPAHFLASLASCPFADVCQVFQTDETVVMLIDNATTNDMVAILLQPSLSSSHDDQSSCSSTSAFLLQPFSQSRIVVSFGSHAFTRIECRLACGSGSHRQIALTDIHPNDGLLTFRRGVCSLY